MAFLSRLKNDPLFAKVIRSSGALFSSNTAALALTVLQGIMAARLLGPAGFGLIGVVMAFASTVNSLFSFRMSELVVRYGGEYLSKNEKEKASALVKAAGIAEGLVSLAAFLVVLVSAAYAQDYLAKTPGTAWMFIVYALGLLANFNTETSTGVLQITDRIKLQGSINLAQSIVVTCVIAGAFFFNGAVSIVLAAYLLGKIIIGLGMFFAAQAQLRKRLGPAWMHTPLSALGSLRGIAGFAFSSNISATLIKIFRESELIWIGLFLDTTAVGYYRVAYAITAFLAIPADPLIATTFPEINKLVVEKAWNPLRRFLKRITAFSFAYNLILAAGLICFGHWAISIYAGPEYLDAYPALAALTIGLAFNYILFWNRPLLLALGLPQFPIYATLIVGLVKLAASFRLIPQFGIVAAGGLLSFYYIASVGLMAWRGWAQLKQHEDRADHQL